MQPRELPNLTVGNRPTMGLDPDARHGQRGFRWLMACSVGLLVAAGVTFSLVAQPTENTKKPKAAVVQDRNLPPPKAADMSPPKIFELPLKSPSSP